MARPSESWSARSTFISCHRPDGGTTLNVDGLSKLPAPVRRGLYFGLQRLIGSNILPIWKELQKWERFSAKQLKEASEERLSKLLATATAQSAYYRSLGLMPKAGESAERFLTRFPILTRERVREHFTRLVVD